MSVDLDKNLIEQFELKFKGDNIISKAEFIRRSIKKYLDDK
ncbi:ribbon-helix-helix protein, CopG family [Monoglobus pectinilyticus]|nr:ribbon-helix-helix protein, CopG family [Clostridiales bacterium]